MWPRQQPSLQGWQTGYLRRGHRVPFFVRWPGGIKQPGRSWEKIVGQVDLLATVAELLGATLPAHAGEDSQSFASVLTNPQGDYERQPLINHAAKGRFSVTAGHWKLILPLGKSEAELYELISDPAEENNVVAEHSEHVAQLEKKATDIVLNGRTTPGAVQANDTGHWKSLSWITDAEYYTRQPKRK
ncbi:MAG: sulfatase/phosphatase domain-containing protein [Pirellulales bacterium]